MKKMKARNGIASCHQYYSTEVDLLKDKTNI
jgi:hypothetical protein